MPTIPIRSPGPSRHVTRSSSTRSPIRTVASSSSSTVRPSRFVAKPSSSTVLRGGGTSAISASAASIRYRGFDVRAGGPRRSQASSLRARFRRRASAASACRERSARA